MATARLEGKTCYGVFLVGGHWRLYRDELLIERFSDEASAIAAGKRAASEALASGSETELLILNKYGELLKASPVSFGH